MPNLSAPMRTGSACRGTRKRRGCDEECMRRIAARLCRLDQCDRIASSSVSKDEEAVTDCCRPSAAWTSGADAPQTTCSRGESSVTACRIDAGDSNCCQDDGSGMECTLKTNATHSDPISTKTGQDTGCCAVESVAEDCCSKKNLVKATGCCKSASSDNSLLKGTTATGCCAPTEKAQSTVGGCCSAAEKIQSTASECCSTTEKAQPKPSEPVDCSDGCCGTSDSVSEKSLRSTECEEKCCDSLSEISDNSPPFACSKHLQVASDRYEALLRLGRCLCRRVLEQMGVCCCSLTADGLLAKSNVCKTHKSPTKSCCSGAKDDEKFRAPCSRTLPYATKAPPPTIMEATTTDIENDAAREHVVVGISGMTCTGCSRKMMNVLANIPGLSNATVTFVSETAEFDVNSTMLSVDQAIPRIEKETGFKLSRIVSGYQHMDVLMSPAAARGYSDGGAYEGIISVAKQGKSPYRITYNPRVIGARSLLGPGVDLAAPKADPRITEGRRRLMKTLIAFVVALVLTIPVVVLNWARTPVSQQSRSITSLVLATLVQGIAIPEFYVGALKSLVYSRVIEMDMLVVISITAAYVYSVIAFALQEAGFSLEQGPFFETATLLVTLILLGRLMSAFARVRAISAVSLRSLQAETAVVVDHNGQSSTIDARLLEFGDIIRILPHSQVVTDGRVLSGESTIDESMVTGESTPVPKIKHSIVVAGTLNGSGTLDVQLTRLPGENSITDIANLVEQAVAMKPRIQDLADKVASYFIPSVIGLALIVFIIWICVALKVRNENGAGAIGLAVTYAIAVLAISCPCALGLAVPMVLVIAGGVSAKAGVIVKAADAIERGYQATDVVFDKTGTLTKGDLQVVHECFFTTQMERSAIIDLVQALVADNDHPTSVAISAHVKEQQESTFVRLESKSSIPGAGIQARLDDAIVKAGNPHWLGIETQSEVAQVLNGVMSCFCVTVDDQLVAVYGLRSTLREETIEVIAQLQSRSITCHVVSGDSPAVVAEVGRIIGIDPANVLGRSLPADKQQYVQRLQSQGRKVVFCGDGTNDAVAVAQADVGVQIGSASDVTEAVADVVLLGGLDGVVTLLDISRRAFNRIRFNFIWSVVYNTFAILLAAGAFVKFRIPPAYAGLGEIVSIAPVILAAASLTLHRASDRRRQMT